MDDDEDFGPTEWSNGQWVPTGQRSQRSRASQPARNTRFSQSQTSRQQPPPRPENPSPDISTQLLSLLQRAVHATPVKEKKPRVEDRERISCNLCQSSLATKATLFNHYKNMHGVVNPAKFLGYKESRVINLDASVEECECTICGLVVPNSHVLSVHLKIAHNTTNATPNANANNATANNVANTTTNTASNITANTVANNITPNTASNITANTVANNSTTNAASNTTAITTANRKERCNECNFEGNNRQELDDHSRVHASTSASTNANSGNVNAQVNAVNALVGSLHKCNKCECYFDDKKRFEEHMKLLHDWHTVCNVCNANLLFKDYDDHVKNSHPEIYSTKNVEDRKERNFARKFYRTKTGKIVSVYKCTARQCDREFDDELRFRRHSKLYHKTRKTRAVDNVEQVGVNVTEDVSEVKDIIYTCEACKVSTASYEVVVAHSQTHLVDANTMNATDTCKKCDLKFEIVCYDQHLTRHYGDDNLNRESFTHVTYKYYLLLSKNWLKSFNMREAEIDRIVSKSIYAYTRSVRMLAESAMTAVSASTTKSIGLYQCVNCKNFVDPTCVASHARNYDTCRRIPDAFPCEICQRSFSAPKALENHMKAHDGNERFRIVLFNSEMDKEYNIKLSDISVMVNSIENDEISSRINTVTNSSDGNNVLYKCMACLLCFDVKETADEHVKLCPTKGPKEKCKECNHWFKRSELMRHSLKHHSCNEATTFVIVNVAPDAIEVDDSETETIDLCGDETMESNIEASNASCAVGMDVPESKDKQNTDTSDLHAAGVSAIEKSNTQGEVSVIKDEEPIDVDECDLPNHDDDDAMSERSGGDSQDTVINDGHMESSDDVTSIESDRPQSSVTDVRPELRCVPTGRLLSTEHRASTSLDADNVKKEVDSEIETVQGQIENVENVPIKKEKEGWSLDPTNFAGISGRPPLGSITSSDDVPMYDLLTDDEESDDMVQINNVTSETPFDFPSNVPNSSEITSSLELEEVNRIKERLVKLSEEKNENESLYHNETSVNTDSGVTENPVEMRNDAIDIDHNSRNYPELTNGSQVTDSESNEASDIERVEATSNHVGTVAIQEINKTALAVFNGNNVRTEIVRKTVVTRNEENIETVIYNPNVSDVFSIRVSRRRAKGQEPDEHHCKLI